MKRKHGIHWFAAIITGLTLAGSAAAFPAQAAGNTPQQPPVPFATIKEVKPFTYCVIAHKGPLTDVSDVITRLMQAVQDQNLFPFLRGSMIGVYYNSPADTKPGELLWEVGFPIAEGTQPKAPLEKKEWKFATVAVAVHKGAYAGVGGTIKRLMDWIKDNGYVIEGPTMERYLNNPSQVKPEELRTEIWIPASKR